MCDAFLLTSVCRGPIVSLPRLHSLLTPGLRHVRSACPCAPCSVRRGALTQLLHLKCMCCNCIRCVVQQATWAKPRIRRGRRAQQSQATTCSHSALQRRLRDLRWARLGTTRQQRLGPTLTIPQQRLPTPPPRHPATLLSHHTQPPTRTKPPTLTALRRIRPMQVQHSQGPRPTQWLATMQEPTPPPRRGVACWGRGASAPHGRQMWLHAATSSRRWSQLQARGARPGQSDTCTCMQHRRRRQWRWSPTSTEGPRRTGLGTYAAVSSGRFYSSSSSSCS